MKVVFGIAICLFFQTSNFLLAEETSEQKEYRLMDQIALKTGTDKSSAYHNYTAVYSKYLSKYRNTPIKFLEIGIQYGNSVKLWEQYFPKGELHFIDIDPGQIKYHSTRSHYHFIDQADSKGLIDFGINVNGNFDVIVDDGGHQMDQIIISFHSLFPFLKKGGLYIVEDLHTSYWSIYGSYGTPENPQSGPGTAIQFLKDLVDDVNYTGARTWCANPETVPTDLQSTLHAYQKEIESIHFYKSLCIIIKR